MTAELTQQAELLAELIIRTVHPTRVDETLCEIADIVFFHLDTKMDVPYSVLSKAELINNLQSQRGRYHVEVFN